MPFECSAEGHEGEGNMSVLRGSFGGGLRANIESRECSYTGVVVAPGGGTTVTVGTPNRIKD